MNSLCNPFCRDSKIFDYSAIEKARDQQPFLAIEVSRHVRSRAQCVAADLGSPSDCELVFGNRTVGRVELQCVRVARRGRGQ